MKQKNNDKTFWNSPTTYKQPYRCQLCGKPIKMLGAHLKKFHGYETFDELFEYYKTYINPNASNICKQCGGKVQKFKCDTFLKGPLEFCCARCKDNFEKTRRLQYHIDGKYRDCNKNRFIETNKHLEVGYFYIVINNYSNMFKVGVTSDFSVRRCRFTECDEFILYMDSIKNIAQTEYQVLLKFYPEFKCSHFDGSYNNTEWMNIECLDNVLDYINNNFNMKKL